MDSKQTIPLDARIDALLVRNNSDCEINEIFATEFPDYWAYLEPLITDRTQFDLGQGRSTSATREEMKIEEICKSHAKKYSNLKFEKNVVIWVHPFYLPLSHNMCVRDESVESFHTYIDNAFKLINNKNTSIVVFESPHHYATITANLLEKKKVDAVVLTGRDNGSPQDFKVIEQLKDKNLFFAGGYVGSCLSCTQTAIERHLNYCFNIFGIKDLILESPNSKKPAPLISGRFLIEDSYHDCDKLYLPKSRLPNTDEFLGWMNNQTLIPVIKKQQIYFEKSIEQVQFENTTILTRMYSFLLRELNPHFTF
ncbi:MAG: hypothetical protein WC758_01925 [Candidatus Woesearchaeota archaeon]|jgi:hypothetical protein